VSMPGVPHQMKGMMEIDVLPKLQSAFALPKIFHRTLITAGIGESFLAERIKDFESALPSNIKMAYLPNYGMVKVRLTSSGEADIIQPQIDKTFQTLKSQIEDVLVADEDISMQKIVGKLLLEKKLQLGMSESCTGGYISQLITSIPGSSEYFKGSIISYSNEMKQKILEVPQKTIETNGAVSKETAEAMTKGTLNVLGVDIALVATGIMGPGGGTNEKPVGTIWIGVGNQKKVQVHPFHFRFDRQRNIELSANAALNILRKFILENW
ncbi:MAG: nicotinamide-nucleotide amidohydrolase family protein, partial [Chitinophagaceae bacterium]